MQKFRNLRQNGRKLRRKKFYGTVVLFIQYFAIYNSEHSQKRVIGKINISQKNLFRLLLLRDLEVEELALLPRLQPLLPVRLLQLAGAVPHVVVVLAGEDVTVGKGVYSVALLDAVLPVTDVPNFTNNK